MTGGSPGDMGSATAPPHPRSSPPLSRSVLLEVYLCFSPELKPIDCPDSAGSSCKASRSLALPSGSAALPEACAAAAA